MRAKPSGQRVRNVLSAFCSFRESPVVFYTMRVTDLCNRAILTAFQFQGAENDSFDPLGCIVPSSVRMSLIQNCVSCVRSAGPTYVLATHFPLNFYPPSMNRKHRK